MQDKEAENGKRLKKRGHSDIPFGNYLPPTSAHGPAVSAVARWPAHCSISQVGWAYSPTIFASQPAQQPGRVGVLAHLVDFPSAGKGGRVRPPYKTCRSTENGFPS